MWRRTPLKFPANSNLDLMLQHPFLFAEMLLAVTFHWMGLLFLVFLLTLINDIEQPLSFPLCTIKILVFSCSWIIVTLTMQVLDQTEGLKKACLLDRKFIFSVYIIVIPINFKLILNLQLILFQGKINRKLLQSVNIS